MEDRKVEVMCNMSADPHLIIDAFTNANMLRDWWGVESCFIETRIGGSYTLAWGITEKGFNYVSTGILRAYKPGEILEVANFTYLNPVISILGAMTLTVKVQKKNSATEFYLCQSGYQSGKDWDLYYNVVKEAWPQVVQGLKRYLEINPA